jgi:arylsulfatase A-like enzyme
MVICHPDFAGGATSGAPGSAVDIAPTLLAIAGVDDAAVGTRFPELRGHSLLPALEGTPVRDGVLVAIESVVTLETSFWEHFGEPDAPQLMQSGELRPDWRIRGFLRSYSDQRYTFARYFSPLEPNRPADVDELFAHNDVVLYDRATDPGEVTNLAHDLSRQDLVAAYRARMESLITAEIGDDMRAWVTEKPRLLGWPTWRGDTAA